MIRKETQTFNDGTVCICAVADVSQPGFRPRKCLRQIHVLRYQERTVGVTRFWAAKAAQERVDRVIRVPQCGGLSIGQVAVLHGGVQYSIQQIQTPVGVVPSVLDLSLRTLEEEERCCGPV